MVHRSAGFKLLLRMMAGTLGGPQHVRGFPPARTFSEQRDESLRPLLGLPHDETAGSSCDCSLCLFNNKRATGGMGGGICPHVMVADSKECGEGVSFLGVRK